MYFEKMEYSPLFSIKAWNTTEKAIKVDILSQFLHLYYEKRPLEAVKLQKF